MLAPARLTTAPAPRSSADQPPPGPPAGSHWASRASADGPRGSRGGRRVSTTTSCPPAVSARTSSRPMYPVPPASTTFIPPPSHPTKSAPGQRVYVGTPGSPGRWPARAGGGRGRLPSFSVTSCPDQRVEHGGGRSRRREQRPGPRAIAVQLAQRLHPQVEGEHREGQLSGGNQPLEGRAPQEAVGDVLHQLQPGPDALADRGSEAGGEGGAGHELLDGGDVAAGQVLGVEGFEPVEQRRGAGDVCELLPVAPEPLLDGAVEGGEQEIVEAVEVVVDDPRREAAAAGDRAGAGGGAALAGQGLESCLDDPPGRRRGPA